VPVRGCHRRALAVKSGDDGDSGGGADCTGVDCDTRADDKDER
jgi:hypothetical protein